MGRNDAVSSSLNDSEEILLKKVEKKARLWHRGLMDKTSRHVLLKWLQEDVAETVEHPNDRRLGYIEGKLAAHLQSGTINSDEYEYFLSPLVDAGLSKFGVYGLVDTQV